MKKIMKIMMMGILKIIIEENVKEMKNVYHPMIVLNMVIVNVN
jgi:hypothetical protein